MSNDVLLSCWCQMSQLYLTVWSVQSICLTCPSRCEHPSFCSIVTWVLFNWVSSHVSLFFLCCLNLQLWPSISSPSKCRRASNWSTFDAVCQYSRLVSQESEGKTLQIKIQHGLSWLCAALWCTWEKNVTACFTVSLSTLYLTDSTHVHTHTHRHRFLTQISNQPITWKVLWI